MGYYAYYQYVKEVIYKYHKSEICNDVSNLQSCNYLCVSEKLSDCGFYSGFSGWIIKKCKKYQVRRMVAHPLPNFALIIINTL